MRALDRAYLVKPDRIDEHDCNEVTVTRLDTNTFSRTSFVAGLICRSEEPLTSILRGADSFTEI